MVEYDNQGIFIGGSRVNRSFLRYYIPRIVLGIWFGGFIIGGLYNLKKSIETDGFTKSFTPGEGGNINLHSWEMLDHNGNLVKKEDFMGKYTLIYFGFTFCPDVCPIEMKKLGDIADILDKRGLLNQVIPIFVSVDYKRDSPKVIKTYMEQYSDKLYGLCGSKEQLTHFARVMKTYFSNPPDLEEDYILEHSTYMYFTGKDGNFKNLTNTEDGPQVLANKVAQWIADDNGTYYKYKEKLTQLFI